MLCQSPGHLPKVVQEVRFCAYVNGDFSKYSIKVPQHPTFSSYVVVLIVVILWLPVCVGRLMHICVCEEKTAYCSMFQCLRQNADTPSSSVLCLLSPLL